MVEPFVLVLLRLGLLILPMTVLWLAGRRLVLSNSANAWLYAATGIFALLTLLGLSPWAVGVANSHPVFFLFAAMMPAVWYSVATICNTQRHVRYDSELERAFLRIATLARPQRRSEPLILEGAEWPDAPVPVFRHAPAGASRTKAKAEPKESPARRKADATAARSASGATQRLLDVARTMRRKRSSEDRRIKLLPPPDQSGSANLPFLKPAGTA